MSFESSKNHDKRAKEEMKLITLILLQTYEKALDRLVEARFYPNCAEAIRASITYILGAEGRFQAQTNYLPPICES